MKRIFTPVATTMTLLLLGLITLLTVLNGEWSTYPKLFLVASVVTFSVFRAMEEFC